MQYNELADTGLMISELTAGNTCPMEGVLGDTEREKDAISALRKMLEEGVNMIDTASSYAGGESELIVGKAIEGFDRERLIITSKFGMTFPTVNGVRTITPDLSPERCITECEQSLRRMNIDYIDIFMPHIPDYHCELEDTFNALEHLQDVGKIRFIGMSNFNKETIERISKHTKITMIEMPYSLIDREFEEDLIWARQNNISTMVYGALGNGILAGAYTEAPDLSNPKDTRSGYSYFYEPRFSKCMRLMKTICTIAEKRNVSPAEVAINWTRRQPAVTTTILGSGKQRHVEMNCRALKWSLTEEEMSQIMQIADVTVGRDVNLKRFFDINK